MIALGFLACLSILLSPVLAYVEAPFTATPSSSFNTTNLSLNDLNSLSNDFTRVRHPQFPKVSIRIKKTRPHWCDPSVSSYTGYIDTSGARHIFFYFFESRNDPANDDVILWATGGPGCSSSLGLFLEMGPCRIYDDSGPQHNPHAWNENANIFYIDQPIGVGFSYADYGESVSTTEEAAEDVAAFVAIFFTSFSEFSGRGFHMAGSSYGGRYIPVFASAVYEQNKLMEAAGVEPVNLKSIIIGNGMTDYSSMVLSYYDMQCTPASIKPAMDIATCVRMKTAIPRCEKWLKESCIDAFDSMSCGAASMFCETELSIPLIMSGKNPYDISRDCDGGLETLCYPVIQHISEYLNRPEIQRQLGVYPNMTYVPCNEAIEYAFGSAMDSLRVQTSFYLEALLDRGVNVLVYVGTYDWICNWVGNQRMVESLVWKDSVSFKDEPFRPWSIRGKSNTVAGKYKSSGGLTFLTIDGAGHMVPHDKPVEALDMLQTWISGSQFR